MTEFLPHTHTHTQGFPTAEILTTTVSWNENKGKELRGALVEKTTLIITRQQSRPFHIATFRTGTNHSTQMHKFISTISKKYIHFRVKQDTIYLTVISAIIKTLECSCPASTEQDLKK